MSQRRALSCLVLGFILLPLAAQAGDPDFEVGEIPYFEAAPWADDFPRIDLGFAMGPGTASKSFIYEADTRHVWQADLRLRLSRSLHLRVIHRRQEMTRTGSLSWNDLPGGFTPYDFSIKQNLLLIGAHTPGTWIPGSWITADFGPAVLWNQSLTGTHGDPNWGLALNVGLTMPLVDHLDLDLGAGTLVVMGDDGVGRKESMLSTLNLGLRVH